MTAVRKANPRAQGLRNKQRRRTGNKKGIRTVHVDHYSKNALHAARRYDFSMGDLQRNAEVVQTPFQGPIRTALWIIPQFLYAYYGGIHTIFRYADFLARKYQIQNTFAIQGVSRITNQPAAIAGAFPMLSGSRYYPLPNDSTRHIPPHDLGICTAWQTAYPLLKCNNVKKKLYFMQDNEPLFYPAGSTYGLAEETYRFGFTGICNTVSLKTIYESYGGNAVHFSPSIDQNVFYPRAERLNEYPYRLFFYGRPFGVRNCFEIAVEALKKIKRRLGNQVNIISAGGAWNLKDYQLGGIVTNVGRLSYKGTGELYRSCHAGLALMMTPHTSYPPIELMASGSLLITNGSKWKEWLLKHNENCLLSSSTSSSIAETVIMGLTNHDLRERLIHNALTTISQLPSWDSQFEYTMEQIFGYELY